MSTDEKKTTAKNVVEAKKPDVREQLLNDLKSADDKKKVMEDIVKKATEEKSAEHWEFVAAVYNQGIPDMKIEEDKEKYKDALKNGCECGSTSCMMAMGESLVKDTPDAATQSFSTALELGDYRAANALGVMALQAGALEEALSKFELASSHNVANAATNLCITRLQAGLAHMNKAMSFVQKGLSAFAPKKKK